MERKVESPTARELVRLLRETRVCLGLKHMELAERLGVRATTLSKRLNDTFTIPDEEWIGRVAMAVDLKPTDIAKFLIDAAIERAKRHKQQLAERLIPALQRIRQTVYAPETKVPQPKSDSEVVIEAFESIGVAVRGEPRLEDAIRRFSAGKSLSDAPFATVFRLYDQIVSQIAGQIPTTVSFGKFSQQLRISFGVRHFPLLTAMLSFLTPFGDRVVTRSVPLLPGVLVHHITMRGGTRAPVHNHDGMEAILALSGKVEMVFEDGRPVQLDADRHELLLYDAAIKHGANALENAAVLVVHYSPKLVRKWDVVEKVYSQRILLERGDS